MELTRTDRPNLAAAKAAFEKLNRQVKHLIDEIPKATVLVDTERANIHVCGDIRPRKFSGIDGTMVAEALKGDSAALQSGRKALSPERS